MSTTSYNDLYIGKLETYRKVITEGEAAIFSGLLGDNRSQVISSAVDENGFSGRLKVAPLFLVGIISGLLSKHIPGDGSQCINMQYEFIAPVFCGDRIETVIELIQLDTVRHLVTYRTDCYDQDKNQVLTGQSVMLVPA